MTTDNIDETESAMERLLKQLIPGIAGLLVMVLGAYVVWFSSAKISYQSDDWGTLGDYFGGLMNPIISFATLMVAFAVWKQQKEELRQTKIALEEQARTAEQQRREQRFFDLLNIYFRTLDSVSSRYIRTITKRVSNSGSVLAQIRGEQVGSELITLNGKSAIAHQLELIESRGEEYDETQINWMKVLRNFIANPTNIESHVSDFRTLKTEWSKIQSESDIGHLLRTITIILNEAEQLLGAEHNRYVDIFVAQLSDDELTLLGYYMWLDQSGENLLQAAKKYGLLRNMKRRIMEFRSCLPAETFLAPLDRKSN